MAASSSTSAAFQFPNISHIVYVKLEGPNYLMWLPQMNPVLRTHEFMGFVDDKPCPYPFLPDSECKGNTCGKSRPCPLAQEGPIPS
jgi:hypothetical protein